MQKFKPYENPKQDGRVKLDPKKHNEIRVKKSKGMSCSSLADEYGVSVSLIKIIVYPRRAESVKKRNKQKWSYYYQKYGKVARAEAVKKYRDKKREAGLAYNPSPTSYNKICPICGTKFTCKRNDQIYCKSSCRFKNYRINMKKETNNVCKRYQERSEKDKRNNLGRGFKRIKFGTEYDRYLLKMKATNSYDF